MSKHKNSNECIVCYHRGVRIFSIGECNHPVCYVCSTRMRVLCAQNECPICRHTLEKVVFTEKRQLFDDIKAKDLPSDNKYNIAFASSHIQNAFYRLLSHVCTLCDRYGSFKTIEDLRNHVKTTHNLLCCNICVTNLKIFPKEIRWYTNEELSRHMRHGDKDNTSHRGHPVCAFCHHTRFVDNDELYRHLRREHYYCHLCEAVGTEEFFPDIRALRDHYKKNHYVCEEGNCINEDLTAVFATEIDFRAHQARAHPKNKQAGRYAKIELRFAVPLSNTAEARNSHHRYCPEVQQAERPASSSSASENQNRTGNENAQSGRTHSPPTWTESLPVLEQEFPALGGASSTFEPPRRTFRPPQSASNRLAIENFPALGSDVAIPPPSSQLQVPAAAVVASTSRTLSSAPSNEGAASSSRQFGINSSTSSPGTSRMKIKMGASSGPGHSTRSHRQENSQTKAETKGKKLVSKEEFPSLSDSVRQSQLKPVQQETVKQKPLQKESVKNKTSQQQGVETKPSQQESAEKKSSQKESVKNKPLKRESVKNKPSQQQETVKNKHSQQKNVKNKPPQQQENAKKKRPQQESVKSTQAVQQSAAKREEKNTVTLQAKGMPPVIPSAAGPASINRHPDHSTPENSIGINHKKKVKMKAQAADSCITSTSNNEHNPSSSLRSSSANQKGVSKSEEGVSKVQSRKPKKNNGEQRVKNEETKENSKLKGDRKPTASKQNTKAVTGKKGPEGEVMAKDRSEDCFIFGPMMSSVKETYVSSPTGFSLFCPPTIPFNAAPPGFSTCSSALPLTENKLTFANSQGQPFLVDRSNTVQSTGVALLSYIYPADFSDRNLQLSARIEECLKKQKNDIDQFKNTSLLYKENYLNGDSYYAYCKQNIDEQRFDELFVELFLLLPDISKQQELWSLYQSDRRKQAAAVSSSIMTCSHCFQLLRREEISSHLAGH